ncbi:uncharacterized protein [Chironomus tepperi]|uniref:uncharacterized protein n=1 Tax=Chironomus tepperi TaxID=113505 RepID=UPI00391EFBCE
MKLIQILFIFAAVGVSLQQSTRCFHCTNCGSSEWSRRDCQSGVDDDDNVGPPTPPTSPLEFSAKNVSLDDFFPIASMNNTNVTTTATTSMVEGSNAQFSCFTMIVDVAGILRTDRGCIARGQTVCNTVSGNNRIEHCFICDSDLCNSGSGQLVYSLFLVAAFYVVWNILS